MEGQIVVPAIQRTARGIKERRLSMPWWQHPSMNDQNPTNFSRHRPPGFPMRNDTGLGSQMTTTGLFLLRTAPSAHHRLQAPGAQNACTRRANGLSQPQPCFFKTQLAVVVQIIDANKPVSLLKATTSGQHQVKPAAPVTKTVRNVRALHRQYARSLGLRL